MTERIDASTPLICSDERHAAKVAELEQETHRLGDWCRSVSERATTAEADRDRYHDELAVNETDRVAAAQRAERAEAAIARVRAKVADWREWNEKETSWAVRDIENAIANTPPPQPEDPAALDEPKEG
jgi:chromosome segregation ATPase